ncbi:hypothetical protein ACFQZZ_20190 [Nocardia sp. GCM10030253]|uniref:hypothetical protein n=1 Tax=Nocardia sp. GCM10030253 TaxID=3273404 RepID=UPI00363B61DB
MTDDAAARAKLALSHKINRLFTTVHPRSAPERTTSSVAEHVSDQLRREVRTTDIEKMRRGEFDSATAAVDVAVLTAIAQCFGVSADYLTTTGPAAVAIDRELELLATMRDANVASIALRGSDIDPAMLTAIIESADRLGPPTR